MTQNRISRVIAFSIVFAILALTGAARGATNARILVYKARTSSTKAAELFRPVSAAAVSAVGLQEVADYPARTLYAGPAASAKAAISALRAQGYDAVLVSELDSIEFQEFVIDVETGSTTPPLTASPAALGSRGLFILSLEGYPKRAWLNDLDARRVLLVAFLPPAGYLVRADRAVAERLVSVTSYVRRIFPVHPRMKKVSLDRPATDPSPYRNVVIEAVEETPNDSIKPYLQSVSAQAVVAESREKHQVRYGASLAATDIETLTHFEQVYSISSPGEASPSSERQGVLALQPDTTGGRMSLPAASPDYFQLLKNIGISSFGNTVFGILDTGFDNGSITLAGIHPDFKNEAGTAPTVISGVSEFLGGFQDDRTFHGTLTAAVISAFAPPGQRHDGVGAVVGHRYTLGLAPTALLRVDKYFNCTSEPQPQPQGFITALGRFLTGTPVNVVNLSWNEPDCGYTTRSQVVDDRSFQSDWLFTISAGNANEVPCDWVRGPATAKNAIAVGSTDNFTIDWASPLMTTAGTCAWCTYLGATENARNIPSFSATREMVQLPGGGEGPKTIVKPDLVAPGVRVTGPVSRATACPFYPPTGVFCHDNIANYAGVARYGFSGGTSFAAPAVAGAAGVVRRWYANTKSANPSAAMTKAILINGARDIAGAVYRDTNPATPDPIVGHIPDKYQGWGMLNLTRLLGSGADYYAFDQGFELSGDGANFVWQKNVYIRDGSKDTHVTLTWAEPGNTNFKTWPLNDLDLQVDQAGTCPCWFGNWLNPSTGYSWQVPPSYANPDRGTNNVEQVIIPARTYLTGQVLRLIVILNYDQAPPVEKQKFAIFADNVSDSSAPPKLYFWTVGPCRLLDTRDPESQFGGPAIVANSERTFQIPPAAPPQQPCGIPNTARAVSVNITVVAPASSGMLRVFPTGVASSLATSVSYSAGQVRADNLVVGLGTTRAITIRPDQPAGAANVILDITGYFE